MKRKSPIRCADGVELVNRWAKSHRPELHMAVGGEQFETSEANNAMMAANLRDGMRLTTGMTPMKPTTPPEHVDRVSGQSMLGMGNFRIEMPTELQMQSGGEGGKSYNDVYGATPTPVVPKTPGFFDSIGQGLRQVMAHTPAPVASAPAPAASAPVVGAADRLRAGGGNWANTAQAPAPVAAPVNRGSGVSFQTARAMKELGLKNGGPSPMEAHAYGLGGPVIGTPEQQKTKKPDPVPSAYTPGEFVASRDMLRKEPELRDHLRELRAEVLAEKGMTVAQADAKALGYGDQGEGHVPNKGRTRAGSGGRGDERETLRAGGGGQVGEPRSPDHAGPDNVGGDLRDPREVTLRAEGGFWSGVGSAASGAWDRLKTGANSLRSAAGGVAGSTASAAKPVVTNVAAGVVPGVAGAGFAHLARDVDNPANNLQAPVQTKTAEDLRIDQQVVKIPTRHGTTPTASNQPYNFFADNDTGRNIGNNLNALSMVVPTGAAATGWKYLTHEVANNAVKNLPKAIPVAAAAVQGAAANVRSGRETAPAENPGGSVAPSSDRPSAYQQRQGSLGPNDNAYHGDLTDKLNAMPTDLRSTGMRANDIYKTKDANGRVTYSGYGDGTKSNSTRFVNGDGTLINEVQHQIAAPGSFASTPDGKGYAFTPAAATAEGRASQKQEWDAKVKALDAREALRNPPDDIMNQPMSKHKRAALVQLRNAETQAAASRYTADQHLRAQMIPYEKAQEQRIALAKLMGSGGQQTPSGISQQAMAAGIDPTPIYAQQKAQTEQQQAAQTFGRNYTNNVRDAVKGQFTQEGRSKEEAEGLEALAVKAFLDNTEGQTLNEQQLREQIPNIVRYGNMLGGARQRAQEHNDSFFTRYGWDDQKPMPTDIDPNATLRKIGGWEGARRFKNVQSGDFELPDGTVIPGDSDQDLAAFQASRRVAAEKQKAAQGK